MKTGDTGAVQALLWYRAQGVRDPFKWPLIWQQVEWFFPLEALGELHEDHLHLETQTHPKLIAVCVLFLTLVSELCVCSTKNSVRVITACTPWKHNRTITPPASCLWHCFFPRNNSGNTGTPKKLSIYRNRGQNYYLWGRHFMATVRNKMSQ